MDNILIGANSENEMYAKLSSILQALRESKLTVNLSKCEFFKRSIQFLGHQLSSDDISPGTAKTAAIDSFPTPTNVSSVRRFLGLSGNF